MKSYPNPGQETTPPRIYQKVGFYVPQAFDAESVLPSDLRQYADCANYLVHLVVCGTVFKHANPLGYVQLKRDYLRKVTPKHVERSIRLSLIDAGVLECDNHYRIGEKAKGYRVSERFTTATHWIQCRDARVAERIRAIRNAGLSSSVEIPVHRYLRDWLRRVKIDRDEAIRTIFSVPDLAVNADMHATSVGMIDDGRWEFTHCRMGRVHTNITRLAHELRPTLSIDGERLTNVDVSNSQPLILGKLTCDFLHENGRNTTTGGQEPAPRATNPTTTQPRHPSITWDISEKNGSQVFISDDVASKVKYGSGDCEKYIELCERGEVYEYMQAALDRAGVDAPRAEVKIEFFRLYFAPNRPAWVLPGLAEAFSNTFAREFPSVARFIRRFKKDAGDYTELACAMQRAESRIVIHGACRRMMIESPHVPLLTIHDSLMVPPQHVEAAKSAMFDAFAESDIRPTLKVTG